MMIELKLFAALREALGSATEQLDLPAEVKTVGDARRYLAARSEHWHAALYAPRVRVALNQRLAREDQELSAGAELAFFPPVTGG